MTIQYSACALYSE